MDQEIPNCVSVAIRAPDGRYYVAARSNTKDQRGVLCFPGGDGEPGVSPRKDAARELLEETGLQPEFCRLEFLKTIGPLTRQTANGEAWYKTHLFTLRLREHEVPQQKEPHKMGPWQLCSAEQIMSMSETTVLPGTKMAVQMTENLHHLQTTLQRQHEVELVH